MNPLYPALERLPFPGFQSSLIADRKRQTAPAAGRGRQPFTGRGYFFERFNGKPP